MIRCVLKIFIAVLALVAMNSFAHQPVMDMAPRWQGGYGIQVRHESYGSDTLLDGDNEINNPLGIERFVDKTWVEGVYTFERSKRITFKLPYVEQQRTKLIAGNPVQQKNSGAGDLIIAVPLKKYFNQGPLTGNWGVTPQLKVPTGSHDGDYPLSDGSWDVGLSVSYSTESYKFYQMYDLFYWRNTEGKRGMREGDEIGIDMNWGTHIYHNKQDNSGLLLMWDITARHHDKPNRQTLTSASGGTRLHTGPVMVWHYENIMARVEYKFSAYEKFDGIGNARGDIFQIGIGVAF